LSLTCLHGIPLAAQTPQGAAAGAAPAGAKPNIIYILADDMGHGDIGPFGSKKNRTPNLDRMAAEGLKLASFYAAPLCTPSRARSSIILRRPACWKQCAPARGNSPS